MRLEGKLADDICMTTPRDFSLALGAPPRIEKLGGGKEREVLKEQGSRGRQ